jgi:hypothetical protein
MLRLSEQVRECLRHADDCAERAKREPNPDIQREFLEIENCWLKQACSYELLEQTCFVHNPQQPKPGRTFQKACAIRSAREQERQPSLRDYAAA